MENILSLKEPVIVIGIGRAGSKIAADVTIRLMCDCLQVSADAADLSEDHESVLIESQGWINPSALKIRALAQTAFSRLASRIRNHGTVIIIANLAGNNGTAISPVVANMAKQAGAKIISVAIMPFGFEKAKIFRSGIALKRLRAISDATIVADNDAFFENNPQVSTEDCFKIINRSVVDVLQSITSHGVSRDVSLVCAGGHTQPELSLENSLAAAYRSISDPQQVRRAIVFLAGTAPKLETLAKLSGYAERAFSANYTSEVETALVQDGGLSQVNLVAGGISKTRFDSYDPLSEIFTPENTLDWEEPEASPAIQLPLFNLE